MVDSNHLFHTVNSLLNTLFEREEAALTKRELAVVTKHTINSDTPDGFRHMGMIYTELKGPVRKMGKYGRLDPSLVPEMEAITQERTALEYDKSRIKQAFTLALKDCLSFQDIRDALPNCMKDLIPECKQLERTRPEAFTLEDNPRSYKQFMELREKIEFYVATRLLY